MGLGKCLHFNSSQKCQWQMADRQYLIKKEEIIFFVEGVVLLLFFIFHTG